MTMPSLFDDPGLDPVDPDHEDVVDLEYHGYEDDDPPPGDDEQEDEDDSMSEEEPDPDDIGSVDDEADEQDAEIVAAETQSPAVLNERMVALSSLRLEHKGWRNPRFQSGLAPDDLSSLAASISRATTSTEDDSIVAGIQDRILVVQVIENGHEINVVLDGQRRCRAMEIAYLRGTKLGAKGVGDDILVPVADFEPGPVTWGPALVARMLVRALETMSTRENLSAFEISQSAAQLRQMRDPDTGKDYTLAKVAAAVGRSESWVSKVLVARERATPKLLHSWEIGAITEEQFKELAGMPGKEQSKAVSAVVEARAAGDKAGARAAAKEQRAIADKAAPKPQPKAPPPAKGNGDGPAKGKGKRPVVSGEQQQLPSAPPRKPPPVAIVLDMLDMASKHPPTHDYVKGLMDGVRWDRGMIDAADFGSPMRTYLQRQDGAAVPAKKPKAGKKARSKGKNK